MDVKTRIAIIVSLTILVILTVLILRGLGIPIHKNKII